MIRLNYRRANINDADLYYRWTNDPLVRKNSFIQREIAYLDHIEWFLNKLNDKKCYFYLFLDENNSAVGQVRIDNVNGETIIGLSIDEFFRGKKLGSEMLNLACIDYRISNLEAIVAYIKKNNISSYKIFEKAGFENPEEVIIENEPTYRLIRK